MSRFVYSESRRRQGTLTNRSISSLVNGSLLGEGILAVGDIILLCYEAISLYSTQVDGSPIP